MHRARSLTLVAALAGLACTTPPSVEPTETEPATAEFATVRDAALETYLGVDPLRAVSLGLHDYDGRVRDVSANGLDAQTARLQADLEALRAVDRASLTTIERVELESLITALDGDLFELEERLSPWRNPMFYMGPIELTPYVARDYAPVEERARAVIAVAEASVAHFEHADANLERALPTPFLDTALLQVRGTISFVERDVPAALAGLDASTQATLDEALAGMAAALRGYEAALAGRERDGPLAFVLGAPRYVEMVRRTQGIDLDMATLRRMANEDLLANLVLAEEVARAIDPESSTVDVIARVAADKPTVDGMLDEAARQAELARQFLIDRDLVSIPTDNVAEVTETPAFMRWNFAFLDGAGPFEPPGLPSFYYISPPDPTWSAAEQQAYVPGKADLLFVTVHEVWPGHFLHYQHLSQVDSRVLQSLWNFTTGEGWAHYAEQMMWEQGLDDDPAVHLGQLQNALLRDVRFLCALGLHSGEMTIDECADLFRESAFQDPVNARQQAVRGSFDPMYLGYTLGKLTILDLRDEWMAAHEGATLKQFHDELLSYGAAPLPAIREAMLGAP